MMIDISLWFMFPVGICIATIAMMAGIGGAVLFAPFFMLVLKLDPLIALGAGLIIEFFGFSSGVIGYWRRRAINFKIAKQLVIFTVPATFAGVLLGRVIPAFILQSLLALLLIYLAYQFLWKGKECLPKHPSRTGVDTRHSNSPITTLIRLTSFLGGLFIGMISAGLGELNEYNFLQKLKLPVPTASATSVFLVAASATVGSFSHAYFFLQASSSSLLTGVLSLLIFTVPGVITGAQFGVFLSSIVNVNLMGKFVGMLFGILGILTLWLIF
jgi:uncharacterized membrane protein YfcA